MSRFTLASMPPPMLSSETWFTEVNVGVSKFHIFFLLPLKMFLYLKCMYLEEVTIEIQTGTEKYDGTANDLTLQFKSDKV